MPLYTPLQLAAFDGAPNANGASISGNTLTLQPASASFPGGVSTTTQTFAGAKTFADDLTIGADLILTSSTNSSLSGSNARIPSHNNANITFTNASLTSIASANIGGVTTGHLLCLTNFTGASITLVNAYSGAAAGEAIYTGSGGDVVLPNRASFILQYNSTAGGWLCTSGGAPQIGTIDSQTRVADGATIIGRTIYLQTANASFPGLVSTSTQTIAGAKTFSGSVTVSGVTNLNQTINVASTGGGCSIAMGTTGNILSIHGDSGGVGGAVLLYGSTHGSLPKQVTIKAEPLSIQDTSGNTRVSVSAAGVVNVSGLTASLPVQTDSSKNLVSSAIDLSGSQATGTIAAARMPALTGDVTTSAGSVATTVAAIQGTTVSGTTGTSKVVFDTAPLFQTNVSFKGSSSGTTVVQPTAVASGTLTLPAATDTLVGKATSDILTNKTISTGGTNLIGSTTISGTTGSTNVMFSASPTTTGTLTAALITSTGATITADTPITVAVGTGTNRIQAINGSNTSGAITLGIESSTGGAIFTGTSAYSTVFGTGNAKSVHLCTNNSSRFTIDSTGVVNIPNLTASQAVFTDSSKNLVSNAITGTGNVVMSASPTLTGTAVVNALTVGSTLTAQGAYVDSITTDSTTTGTLTAYSVSGKSIIAFTASTTLTFQGLASGITGQVITLQNQTGNNMTISNNNGSGTQKIIGTSNADVVIPTSGAISLWFDGTFWRMLSVAK